MIINNIPFTTTLEEILLELKTQLNINGINLLSITKNTNNDIMVQCPYHSNGQERKPSAGIRKSDGQFHCFACGETHSLQEVISYCFGWNDILGTKGWEWLLKNFATISIEKRKPISLDVSRKLNRNIQEYISEKELDSYRYYHSYMWKRKLTPEIVEMFDIGYDKNTECLTFPQRDIHGNTLFIARRSVKTKYFNYPEDVEKPLYGIYELNQIYKQNNGQLIDEVIVCESMLDALVCWVWGKYAVAMNGLGTPQQFKALKSLRCRKLILATDNDDKGLKARKKIRENITNKIITEYILPKGKKDINDLTEEEFNNLKEVFV